jgi:hypothetical protein
VADDIGTERFDDGNDHTNRVNPVQAAGGERDGKKGKRQNLLKLAEKDPKKAAKKMVQEWDATHRQMSSLFAQWRANRARFAGWTGVECIKVKDEKVCRIPLNATVMFGGMNKAARLTRRITSQIFSDAPLPDVEPEGNSDEERDAAEFTGRALSILGDAADLDSTGTARDAWDRGNNYGSGFRHWWVDPRGGGHRPMQILAKPDAETVEDALAPALPGDIQIRYVKDDGTLTDEPKEARRKWLPRLQREVLTGKHIRFIPQQVRDVEDADGMMMGAMVPYGTVKRIFPKIRDLDPERRQEILTARPHHARDLLPLGKEDRTSEELRDDQLVFVLTRYHRSTPDYPRGAHLIALGEDFLAHHDTWWDEENDQPLDIPIDQFKQMDEEDNPYGLGMMELLGPANEIRARILGTLLEYMAKFSNLKVFVPLMSTLQAQQLQSPTKTYIPIPQGGEPKTEQMPNFPVALKDFLEFTTTDMDDESTLQEVAQGLAPASVQSGRQAQQIVEQVHAALSGMHHNAGKGLVRGWRIMAQLVRAFYTAPQQISWIGEDGAYKQKSWVGSDLTSAKHIRIKRGTFTMLQPTQKTLLASEQVQIGGMSVAEFTDITSSGVQGLTGLRENAHRMRARRQITAWQEGPPEDWQPPQPQQGPQTGQEIPGEDPLLAQMLNTLPPDIDPENAALRTYEFGKAISSSSFGSHPPEWQQGLLNAYQLSRQAAGITTIEEQQQAQQQQEQAQQQEIQAQQQAAQTQQETKLQEALIKSESEERKTQIAANAKAQETNFQLTP